MFTAASFVIKKKKKKNFKQIMVITIWKNTITELRFMCPTQSETNQYQHVGIWAEKGLLQGDTRRQEAHARPTLNSLKDFRTAFLKVRWWRGAVGCHELLGAAIFHPQRLGQDVPVNLQQNKCHSVLQLFISIWIEKCYTLKGWSLENGLSHIF